MEGLAAILIVGSGLYAAAIIFIVFRISLLIRNIRIRFWVRILTVAFVFSPMPSPDAGIWLPNCVLIFTGESINYLLFFVSLLVTSLVVATFAFLFKK